MWSRDWQNGPSGPSRMGRWWSRWAPYQQVDAGGGSSRIASPARRSAGQPADRLGVFPPLGAPPVLAAECSRNTGRK